MEVMRNWDINAGKGNTGKQEPAGRGRAWHPRDPCCADKVQAEHAYALCLIPQTLTNYHVPGPFEDGMVANHPCSHRAIFIGIQGEIIDECGYDMIYQGFYNVHESPQKNLGFESLSYENGDQQALGVNQP